MYKRFFFLLLFSFLFFLFSACNEGTLPNSPEIVTVDFDKASPSEFGIDTQMLNSGINDFNKLGYVNSLLILTEDKLISEDYFNGHSALSAFNSKSVSKVFISALVGIAIKQGILKSTDLPVMKYFEEYKNVNGDDRIDSLTIEHLLTMTSGFLYGENRTTGVLYSDNWVKNTLALPFYQSPGVGFNYNTALTHLLSAIISKSAGQSTLQYGKRNLFDPLNIIILDWQQDPQGYYFGGSEVFLTARSMLRFGQLFLHNGNFNGKQIISPEWIERSLSPKLDTLYWSLGNFTIDNYGYYWYLTKQHNLDIYFAFGFGGQFIINIPEKNTCVVITADTQVDPQTAWDRAGIILEIFRDSILPVFADL